MTKPNAVKTLILGIGILATGVFQSCKKSDSVTTTTGTWYQRSSFEGNARGNAVSFTLNGIAYVGTGYDNSNNRLGDLWAFNVAQNQWYAQDSLPSVAPARSEAVAFALEAPIGKAYIGTGTDGLDPFSDFWEFTPDPGGPANGPGTWAQIADLGTNSAKPSQLPQKRSGAVAFALNGYGYVGTGYNQNALKDFWRYDPVANNWTVDAGTNGSKRYGAFSFVIGSKAYIGGGINNNTYLADFQEFTPADPANFPLDSIGRWVFKDGLDDAHDIRRVNAATCVINGRGIVSTGFYNVAIATVWEYQPDPNPSGTGTWTQKVDFAGGARRGAVGITVGNQGFVLTGINGNNRYDDMWELLP